MLAIRKQLRSFRRGRVRVANELRSQRRIRDNLERSVARKLTSLFPKFVRTEADKFLASTMFNESEAIRGLQSELFPVMARHYKRVFSTMYAFNEGRYEDMHKSVDVPVFGRNRDIEGLILLYNENRQLFLSSVSAGIAAKVAKVITECRGESLSLAQIAKNITTKVGAISRSRAMLVARTETHNAAGYAHHQYHGSLGQELGMTMVKRWTSTQDLRTRSFHAEANGQTVSMDEPFIVGGVPMMYAGDPQGGAKNVVNCRCVIVYVDAADQVD